MKLICKCGNIMDFENDENTTEGFEIYVEEYTNELTIKCAKCDKVIQLLPFMEDDNDEQ